MRWRWIIGLGAFGGGVGVLTLAVSLPWWAANAVWACTFGLFVAAVVWQRHAPFQTGLAACLLAGLLLGVFDAALLPVTLSADPDYGDAFGGTVNELRVALFARGVVLGYVVGLVVAGLAWAFGRLTGRTVTEPVSGEPAPLAR